MVRSLLSLLTALAFVAAGGQQSRAADIVIGVPFWPSAEATAHIISQALQNELDVTTELRQSGTLGIFVGLDRGEIHVHPEIWMPKLASVVAEHGGERGALKLTQQGVEARRGICTTRATADATGLRRVSDLAEPQIARNFDSDGDGKGEMWIGAVTSPSTMIERVRARSYGYADTMSLLAAPEYVAMASVDVAVAVGRPVVFQCQSPHHIFQLHDIVFLDEPEHDPATWSVLGPEDGADWLERSKAASAWDNASFHIGYAASLDETSPEVVRFLENVSFTLDEIVDMSYSLGVAGQSPEDYATRWIAVNHARVREWAR